MTTSPYGVTLSQNKKEKLGKAFKANSAVTIRLSNEELSGNDLLILSETQIDKLKKAKTMNEGTNITLSETQIRKNIERDPLAFDGLDIIEFNNYGTVTPMENHPLK